MPVPLEARIPRLLARRDVACESSTLMDEYNYRPSEVLVHAEDYGSVADELRRWEAEELPLPGSADGRPTLPDGFPIRRFRLAPRMNVAAVVSRLRQVPNGPEPRVGPNYVYSSDQIGVSHTADVAEATTDEFPPNLAEPGDFTVGVLDTGIVLRDGQPHPWLAGHVDFDPARHEDPLDVLEPSGMLDEADAHGTFVAGLVLRQAPRARVRIGRVLFDGYADELEVAAGILELASTQVINLSFGEYSLGDVPPVALECALDRLSPQTVVVASAGNYGRRRPSWPAAFKRVIAVGAVHSGAPSGGGLPARASWSNLGWWVDACASGVRMLSTFCEFEEHGFPDAQTFNGWAHWSGTSFSAPVVAGRIAAEAIANNISAQEAAYRIVLAPGLPHVPGMGTYVG
ncbi:MAG: S8 family peptidase [Egibacteraceae bacterium]